MNIYKSFVYMFYALDAIYDECPDEELGNYLSGLNPFLFDDESSANPAEYEAFEKCRINQFGDKEPVASEIYEFCREYLAKNAPEKAIEAFDKIEKDEWIESFKEEDKSMKESDVARLTNEFERMAIGTEGTIVLEYDGKCFEVEFFDENGDTIDVVTTPSEVLELVQSY